MADDFYTMQEAAEKLQKNEQEVQDLVKQGQLRQYMDNGKPMFKKEDIDSLSEEIVGLDISAFGLTPEDTAPELQLEETSPDLELEGTSPDLELEGTSPDLELEGTSPDLEHEGISPDLELEETSPDLELEETSPELQLEETSEIQLEPDESKPESEKELEAEELKSEGGFGLSQMGDLSSADTNIGTVGINILSGTEDAFKLTEDTKAETRAEGEEEDEIEELENLDADSNLESFGSGSGLLDLSLQADDTSLGAVLDDILPTGAEEGAPEGGELPVDQIGLAEESEDLLAEPAMVSPDGSAQVPVSVESTAPTATPTPGVAFVPVAQVDPRTNMFGIAMFLTLLFAIIPAGIILTAAIRDIRPSLLNLIVEKQIAGVALFWYILGAVAILAVLFSLFASVGGGEAKPKKAKVKKEKKAKVKKEKKVKVKKPKKEKKKKGK